VDRYIAFALSSSLVNIEPDPVDVFFVVDLRYPTQTFGVYAPRAISRHRSLSEAQEQADRLNVPTP
jgi:hypothetical protein